VVADDARIRRILSLSGVESVLSIDASLEGARAHFANERAP
jgi:hypothetical protein